MFSTKEKQQIAKEIEELLLKLDHPEMPKEKPIFTLYVNGKENWSWAKIEPNHVFSDENKPGFNQWNETAREVMKGAPDPPIDPRD